MKALKSALDGVLGALLAALLGLAVLTVLWQVVSRYVLADPSAGTDELVRFLLIWIGLLGTPYAAGQRLHLSVDLLPRALGEAGRRRQEGLVHGVTFLFGLGVLGWGGGGLVGLSFELGQRSASLGLPLGWIYLAVPLSGVLLSFYSLFFLYRLWGGEDA